MTDRRYDPQGAAEIERAILAAAIEEFRAYRMSDDMFKATLFARGYRGNELDVEYRFQWDERYRDAQVHS